MDKLNNLLSFNDFDKTWKPTEQKKTKRTELGKDILNENVESVAAIIAVLNDKQFIDNLDYILKSIKPAVKAKLLKAAELLKGENKKK